MKRFYTCDSVPEIIPIPGGIVQTLQPDMLDFQVSGNATNRELRKVGSELSGFVEISQAPSHGLPTLSAEVCSRQNGMPINAPAATELVGTRCI